MTKISISSENYKVLVDILSIFDKNCNDVSIMNGKIFQMSNNKSIIYDIDLSPIVGKNTFIFNDFSEKYQLLNMFKIQNSNIEINIDERSYTIGDSDSYIEIQKPEITYLTCKPIKEDSDAAQAFLAIDKNAKILDYTFKPLMLDKINVSSTILKTDNITVKLDGDFAEFFVLMKTIQTTKTKLLTLENVNNEGKFIIEFPIQPFLIKADNIETELFKNKSRENKYTMKFLIKMGIEPQIEINMYSTKTCIEGK